MLKKFLTKGGEGLLFLYRKGISPFFPPCCRFVPTCSEYAMLAWKHYGCWQGGWLIIKRLLKCHPWGPFGLDLPPEQFRARNDPSEN